MDVSHHNGRVDWHAAAVSGIAFGYAKATEGTRHIDAEFVYSWAGMATARVLRGAYHFLDPDSDGEAQARHFLSVLPGGMGDLPPALDVEAFGARTRDEMCAKVGAWLRIVDGAIGRRSVIYCSRAQWEESVSCDFSGHPLWVADYTGAAAPRLPRPWRSWVFWQWADRGGLSGPSDVVDADRWNGDLEALRAFASHPALSSQGRR